MDIKLDNKLQEIAASLSTVSSMDFNRCLSNLTKAGSDNEKMAAMLLAAKLIKSGDIGGEDRKKIFNAIGFNFLNRLFATKNSLDQSNDNPYHAIAVTIVACFCTDQELAVHPQVTSKIPLFNECISHCEDNLSMAEDALQCLQGVSTSPTGCRHLLRPGYSTLQALAKCYLSQTTVSEGAKGLMLHILAQEEVRVMENFSTCVSSLIAVLAAEFRTNQDDLKFQLCQLLHSIFLLTGDSLELAVGGAEWVGYVSSGLRDILTSQLDCVHREPALYLAALLCQLFTLEWVAPAGSKFMLLLVDLFKVESRLTIDGKELTDVCKSSELLCSCFIVFESAIAHLLRHDDLSSMKGLPLTEEDILHLHSSLTEAFTFVLHLLKQLESTTPIESSLVTLSMETTPLLIACVRVVGAWLAEDSLSLSTDIYSCLPFLVLIAKLTDSSEAEREGKDLLKFLLPGLSHLAAEDKPRAVLVRAGLWSLLQSHLQRRLLENPNEVECVADDLRLCCEVMVTMCVCEGTLLRNTEEAVTATALISRMFIRAPSSCPTLKMNALLLLILITNNKTVSDQIQQHLEVPLREMLGTVLDYLVYSLRACPGVGGPVEQTPSPLLWEEVSELWFIAMQELSRCVVWRLDLIEVATKGEYVHQLTTVLGDIGEISKGNEQLESVITALCSFLQTMGFTQ